MSVQRRLTDALTFCCVLFGNEPTEYRLIGPRGQTFHYWGYPETTADLAVLESHNDDGCSVYAVINRCAPEVEARTKNRKGATKAHIIGIRAAYVDFDTGTAAEIHQKLAAAPLGPSIVISSGLPKKLHAYWLLADLPVSDFERTQRALITRFGSDPKVTDTNRVMRLPGFVNTKPEYAPNNPVARLLSAPGNLYTRAELFDAFGIPFEPPAPARAATRPLSIRSGQRGTRYVWAAVQGEHDAVAAAREGTRNDRLHKAAVKLGSLVGAGVLPEEDARDALTLAAEKCGLPAHEAQGTITSGLTYGIAHPREMQGRA